MLGIRWRFPRAAIRGYEAPGARSDALNRNKGEDTAAGHTMAGGTSLRNDPEFGLNQRAEENQDLNAANEARRTAGGDVRVQNDHATTWPQVQRAQRGAEPHGQGDET
jgi:hypothetical protein